MKILSLLATNQKPESIKIKEQSVRQEMAQNPQIVDLFFKIAQSLRAKEDSILIENAPSKDIVISVEEVEKLLGLSRPTCNNLLDSERVDGFKTPKGHRRFYLNSVLSYKVSLDDAREAKLKIHAETKADQWEI